MWTEKESHLMSFLRSERLAVIVLHQTDFKRRSEQRRRSTVTFLNKYQKKIKKKPEKKKSAFPSQVLNSSPASINQPRH